ncbi:hypothetical protein CFOL_v3_31089 [Cephalotus follicularis]|uniref:Uncharacterized protein n=1 Tax=Cephalotus follicularis TaxID=3775 RepID=A0A1Q3D5S8_CEPFO|nr:hypothetical protein CFOL_v3_31089 [Cephalotus follicularis]
MINTDKQKESSLLLKLEDKIDNPDLKREYLLKLKDLITNEPSTSNKNSEIERGTPRLVINYKPLNIALQWIRHPIPNKKDLLKRLSEAKLFSKFDLKLELWQIQNQENNNYKIIPTNDLVLSKLELFITHNKYLRIITSSQKYIMFTITFPDIIINKEQLPNSSFIICFNIDSSLLSTSQICQQAFSGLQEMESIKDTLPPTKIKKIMSDTLSSTEIKKIMSNTLSFTKKRIRYLQKNETFEKRLQSLCVLEKILVCDTTIICSVRMKTLCVKIPFNNSNHTPPNPYKRDSFHTHPRPYKNSSFHSFIKTPEIMETLSSDRATESTKKRKFPSPTEIEESEKNFLSLTEIKCNTPKR